MKATGMDENSYANTPSILIMLLSTRMLLHDRDFSNSAALSLLGVFTVCSSFSTLVYVRALERGGPQASLIPCRSTVPELDDVVDYLGSRC